MSVTPPARHVTLRHASSCAWCIEAPHPTFPTMPQPYSVGNRSNFKTLSAAVKRIESHGMLVIPNRRTKERVIYCGGAPLLAV